MSRNWKLLANKSLERNRSLSTKKNSSIKYNPQKHERTPQDSSFISPSMMNSFSRVDSSSILGIQDKKEKESERQFSHFKSSAQKGCVISSLNNEIKKNNSEKKFSDLPPREQPTTQPKQDYAIKELETLKKQFKKFRDQIMLELQKQQKMLEKLVRDTVKNYYEKQTKAQQDVFQKNRSTKRQTPTFNFPIIEDLKSIVSPKSSHSQMLKPKIKLPPFTPEQKSSAVEKNGNENQRFDRFFQAISKLRNNLKDLSTLSQVDSIISPRNQEGKHFTFKKDAKMSH